MLPIYSTKCHQKRWGISRQEETMAIYSPKEEHLQIHWHDLRNLSKHLYMNFFFCTWILEDKKRTNQLGTRRVKLSRYHRVTRLPSTWLLHLPSASLKIHLETGQSGVATQVLPESRRRTQGGQSLILNQHIDQYLHRDGSMAPCVRVQHPLSLFLSSLQNRTGGDTLWFLCVSSGCFFEIRKLGVGRDESTMKPQGGIHWVPCYLRVSHPTL